MSQTTHRFEAEVSQVLRLVINSLYSNKEIFIRELVSNASDALDKLRFESITNQELLGDDPNLRIRLHADTEAGTLTIEDNGIGMTKEELVENLGTIAHSGSRAFLENMAAQASGDVSLIGQFGVGFYSSYLVADQVEVITKRAGEEQAWCWSSDATDTFTIEEAQRETRGTAIILHLKEDQKHFANDWTLKNLISRYADYVSHPIELPVENHTGEEDSEETTVETTWEQVNEASALWQRSADDVTDEQYEEFYKHLTHDFEAPLTRTHFKLEGTQQFKGLIFVPARPAQDLFDPNATHGVRLYVKRVFIMENCEELIPKWMRFVRGVVDSDDLPLNVSRELLQDSRAVNVIQKQVIKKVLQMLDTLSKEDNDKYETFWNAFGKVFKEGLHFSPQHADKLMPLLRFESSHTEGLTSLADYVERMPEDQSSIYYALGQSKQLLESSPNLEGLRKKGYEVLYMVDGVDQWAVMGLSEFDEKKFVSAMTADLDLGESDEDKKVLEEKAQTLSGLTDKIASVLDQRVQEVRVSDRLNQSPVCLVVPEGGVHAHIERMLRANDQAIPQNKRILEINPDHTLIKHLDSLQKAEGSKIQDWIELLYDQALITEGSPVEDPNGFARRISDLMTTVVAKTVTT